MEDAKSPQAECTEAITLAMSLIGSELPSPSEWKLISVENHLVGADANPNVWRLAFKPRRLIPTDPDEAIGKGGEKWIEVDLKTRTVARVKSGE